MINLREKWASKSPLLNSGTTQPLCWFQHDVVHRTLKKCSCCSWQSTVCVCDRFLWKAPFAYKIWNSEKHYSMKCFINIIDCHTNGSFFMACNLSCCLAASNLQGWCRESWDCLAVAELREPVKTSKWCDLKLEGLVWRWAFFFGERFRWFLGVWCLTFVGRVLWGPFMESWGIKPVLMCFFWVSEATQTSWWLLVFQLGYDEVLIRTSPP